MPISSGFGSERSAAFQRTQLSRPIRRPQIVARAQQFQEDTRNKQQRHVPFSKNAAGRPSPPARPTAVVKQPSRSNTFTLPKNAEHQQINGRTTRELPKLKGRVASPPPPPPPRAPKKQIMAYHSAAPTRPTLKPIPTMIDQRRPVRFASEVNYAYPSTSTAWSNVPPPPPHHHPPPPVPNRTIRTIHDDYPPSQYRNAYTDYPSSTVQQQPVVHLLRRPAPRNYVYLDDDDDDPPAATQIIRRRRRRRPRQPEVVYIDEDDEYADDDVVYVDENGRQIDYIYDEPVRYRSYPKVRQTNSTAVVYQ